LGEKVLTMLINGPVVVDLHHIFPAILGQGLKPLSEHGKGGGISSKGSEEPPWESLRCIVLLTGVQGGVNVSDNREV
jgi:hypothetical protein